MRIGPTCLGAPHMIEGFHGQGVRTSGSVVGSLGLRSRGDLGWWAQRLGLQKTEAQIAGSYW